MSNCKKRTFTAEFKAEAVKLIIKQGYKQTEAARNLGIDPSLLGKWIRTAKSTKEISCAFPGKGNLNEILKLKKQLNKVRREKDILKKSLGYFVSHPE